MGESHYSFCSAWSLCLWPLAAALVKNMSWIKQKLPPRKSSKWCPKELKLGVQTRIVCLTQKTCLLFSFLHFKLISSLNKPSPVLCPYPGACCSSLKRLPLPPWCLAKARSNCRNAGISAACSAVPWKNVEKQWIIMDYSKIMINNICFSRVGSQKNTPFEQWCPQILNVLTLDPFIFQWQKRWCPFFLIACLASLALDLKYYRISAMKKPNWPSLQVCGSAMTPYGRAHVQPFRLVAFHSNMSLVEHFALVQPIAR